MLVYVSKQYWNNKLTVNECCKFPENCEGKELSHFIEAKILNLSDSGFLLENKGNTIGVHCNDCSMFSEGNYFLEIKAVFHQNGYLTINDYILLDQDAKCIKNLVSVIASIIVIVLMIFRYNHCFCPIKKKNYKT